jgi:hypothetical protein
MDSPSKLVRTLTTGHAWFALSSLIVCLVGRSFPAQCDDISWIKTIRPTVENSVVCLRVVGITYKDKQEKKSDPWYGTGFVISKYGHVLTTNHLFPDGFDRFEVTGKVKDRFFADSEFGAPLTKIDAAPQFDLRLLRFQDSSAKTPVQLCDSFSASNDDPVFILGFPKGAPLLPSVGILSNTNGTDNGLWITDAKINPGNSGSPVFNRSGKVIAVVEGDKPGFEGINYLIPIDFANSLLGVVSVKLGCSEMVASSQSNRDSARISLVAELESSPVPSVRYRDVAYNKTQDIHGLSPTTISYTEPFPGDAGFKVTEASFKPLSCIGCGPVKAAVADSANQALLSYTLTSGPLYDKTRGSINGVVHLTETAEPSAPTSKQNVTVSPDLTLSSGEPSIIPVTNIGNVKQFSVQDLKGQPIAEGSPGTQLRISDKLGVVLTQEPAGIKVEPYKLSPAYAK